MQNIRLWNLSKKNILKFILYTSVIGLISYALSYVWVPYNWLFHTTFELICIFIAVTSFITIWMTYDKSTILNRTIGFGFLLIAIFDSLHTFFYNQSLGFFSNGYTELMANYWLLGRLTEGLILLIGSSRILKIKVSKYTGLIIALIVCATVSFTIYKYSSILPQMLNKNLGVTLPKIEFEYFIILLFFINILVIKNRVKDNELLNYKYIMISLIIAIPAEFCFTVYTSYTSFFIVLGHVLKTTYYIYLFKAIFVSSISNLDSKYNKVLDESEERFRSAFDYVLTGVTITDISGNWIRVNDALCRMLGYTKEELLNKSFKDFTHPDDSGPDIEKMHEMVEGKIDSFNMEKRYIHKTGKVIWILLIASIVRDENGTPQYFLSQVQDISSIKEAEELQNEIEEKTRQLEEAVELDKLKTEFFANLSHEFKTPINVIQSSLQLLDLYTKQSTVIDGHTFNKYSSIMKQNCRRLQRLVNNLIDTTRMDVGYYNINLRNLDIVKLASDVTLSVADYIKNKGIEISFHSEVESLYTACDPDSIERVLLNLLSNSVKFTNKGGSIVVTISAEYDKVLISVKDTGIGIPKNKINSIFERFHQVDKLLTRNHEGSGIGLSIVKTLVEMHEGRILVKSEYRKGSEFIVELPINEVDEKSQVYNSKDSENRTEKLNIEFSDIYLYETS